MRAGALWCEGNTRPPSDGHSSCATLDAHPKAWIFCRRLMRASRALTNDWQRGPKRLFSPWHRAFPKFYRLSGVPSVCYCRARTCFSRSIASSDGGFVMTTYDVFCPTEWPWTVSHLYVARPYYGASPKRFRCPWTPWRDATPTVMPRALWPTAWPGSTRLHVENASCFCFYSTPVLVLMPTVGHNSECSGRRT